MPKSLTEMAKELVEAMVKNNLIAPQAMQEQLQKIHASLIELKAREDRAEAGIDGAGDNDALQTKDWKKSIRQHTIECLVCGQTFKQLSVRHLRQHDLDPRTYRQQFGIPRSQSLAAKATTAMRKRVVQETRPWEKAPTFRKSQEEAAPPQPPAQPKRTRKKAASTSSA